MIRHVSYTGMRPEDVDASRLDWPTCFLCRRREERDRSIVFVDGEMRSCGIELMPVSFDMDDENHGVLLCTEWLWPSFRLRQSRRVRDPDRKQMKDGIFI